MSDEKEKARIAELEHAIGRAMQLAEDVGLLGFDGFAVLQAVMHDGIPAPRERVEQADATSEGVEPAATCSKCHEPAHADFMLSYDKAPGLWEMPCPAGGIHAWCRPGPAQASIGLTEPQLVTACRIRRDANNSDAVIATLRADLARVTQERDDAVQLFDERGRRLTERNKAIATLTAERDEARGELQFIKSYLSHQDQDANHGFIVRRINDVLAGRDPSPDTTEALIAMGVEERDEARALRDEARKALLTTNLVRQPSLDVDGYELPGTRLHARIKGIPREDREMLGMAVRAEWVRWACEQPNPKPHWLAPWEELSEPDKDVDRRIGVRLANIGRCRYVEV
jgi:hypothetical protein